VFKTKLNSRATTTKEQLTSGNVERAVIGKLAQSMPARLQAVIMAKGGHTKY
jgi:hypothetical protein